jgi:hypothetical protein
VKACVVLFICHNFLTVFPTVYQIDSQKQSICVCFSIAIILPKAALNKNAIETDREQVQLPKQQYLSLKQNNKN